MQMQSLQKFTGFITIFLSGIVYLGLVLKDRFCLISLCLSTDVLIPRLKPQKNSRKKQNIVAFVIAKLSLLSQEEIVKRYIYLYFQNGDREVKQEVCTDASSLARHFLTSCTVYLQYFHVVHTVAAHRGMQSVFEWILYQPLNFKKNSMEVNF